LSQYPFPPSPYVPPGFNPGSWASGQPRTPARSASNLQMVLGGILALFGTCIGSLVWLIPDDVLGKVVQQQGANLPPMNGYSPIQEMRILSAVTAGAMLLAGILLLVLAFFVRRGGRISAVCSIVANSVIGIFILMDLLAGVGQGAVKFAIFPLVILVGLLALDGTTIAKLVASLRSSGDAQIRAMQQAHYWMMQQQQSSGAFGQSGYGYGQGAVPPPSAPPPEGNVPPPPT
jgi:hypothetical protein